MIYLCAHFSRSPTSYYNASCHPKEIRGYTSVTTKRAVTFRIRLVMMSLRLFLDDDSSSDGEKKEKKMK